jgi:DNA primase
MHINKESILAKVSTFDILRHFLQPYYDGMPFKPGVHVYVPEISGEQKTPSFNVYHSRRSGEYRYKDFVGNDGSAFDLVMNLYNVKFVDAIKIINKEMNLGLEDDEIDYHKVKPKVEPKIEVERDYSYKIEYDIWKNKYLKFWSAYGTSQDTLEFFNIRPLKRLSAFRKDNSPFEIKTGLNRIIFVIERKNWAKLYIPRILNVQEKSFMYVGKKPSDYVFGLEQLPDSGDDLYLVGGEKDTVNMYSHGMSAVCLTSEESTPRNYPSFMELLESGRFKNYYISYDNDSCGRRQMVNISNDIPQIKPKMLNIPDGYDISEWLKDKYRKRMF